MTESKTTNPLSGRDIIYCCDRTDWTGQNDKHFIRINCKSREDAFEVQSQLMKVRDEN